MAIHPLAHTAPDQDTLTMRAVFSEEARQDAAPINRRQYVFVGTDCILLGGCFLPDLVFGAKSLLDGRFADHYRLHPIVADSPGVTRSRFHAQATRYFSTDTGFRT
jgi:phage protein U